LTIPCAKQIEYRAFYEVVFNWHYHDLAFSHNLDPERSHDVKQSFGRFILHCRRPAQTSVSNKLINKLRRCFGCPAGQRWRY
jgi:hypothetical protein